MVDWVYWDRRHIDALMDVCALIACGQRFTEEERLGILKQVLDTAPEHVEELVERFAKMQRTRTGT